VNTDGEVKTESPAIADTPPPEAVSDASSLQYVTSRAEELNQLAEDEAWIEVESFADEAREQREREYNIKRRHAERYFEEEIQRWEERLERYRALDEEGEDMSAPIGNARRELENLRREQEQELAGLEKKTGSRKRAGVGDGCGRSSADVIISTQSRFTVKL
jgi:hypothetical protein